MIICETPRLIIRQFDRRDIDALGVIFSDPDVMHYSITGPKSRQETLRTLDYYLNQYTQLGCGNYAVVAKNDGVLIGCCGLILQTIDNQQEMEIGYRFAKEYWGKGLATEAALACRDYAFRRIKLERLISLIQPENLASIRIAQKLGMRRERATLFYGIEVYIYGLNISDSFI